MTDEKTRRQAISFLEAEGLKLPRQLAGHEITRPIRIAVMAAFAGSYEDESEDFDQFGPMWTSYFQEYGDDFPEYWDTMRRYLRRHVEAASDAEILDLIQYFCRQDFCSDHQFEEFRSVLETERLAYRLVGEARSSSNPPTLLPVGSKAQGERLTADYDLIGNHGGDAAQRHLRQAAVAISSGDFKSSIRESIHAVESAAKFASGKSTATLPDALASLEKQRSLHPALKQALSKLYGWTSDEKGIRHADIGPTDDVTESMALFMLSSCAAFSSWLLNSKCDPVTVTPPSA